MIFMISLYIFLPCFILLNTLERKIIETSDKLREIDLLDDK
jgi:hypothetical protein